MSVGKKYHKLDFSVLEDEILIEKVKENPPLHAKQLKSYKDMKMKDNIWAKIAKEMAEPGFNRTGEECKKRWSNLRDYYVRKKKASSTGSAASSQGNEKFDHMHFLDNTALVHRTTKSNVSTTAVTDGKVSADNERVEDGSDIESLNDDTENHSIIEENEEVDETQEIRTTATQVSEVGKPNVVEVEAHGRTKRVIDSETLGRIDRKKSRLQDIDKERSERITLLRDIAQRASTSTPQSTEDPVDLFFNSLAATAKTLSPWNLAEAKRKLFLVMAEIEEKNIEEKYRDRYRPLSHPSPSPLTLSLSSPPISLPSYSEDSASAFHDIGQTEYVREHPRPSYNTTKPINQEPMMSSDCSIQSYLSTYTPL